MRRSFRPGPMGIDRPGSRPARLASTLLLSLSLAAFVVFTRPAHAQQIADSTFAPAIAAPAYPAGAGPVVLLDEAHVNFHTLEGRYLPFGRLLTRDGYRVRPNRERFTPGLLAAARVLVIANALNKVNETEWTLPTPSAFDSTECVAVREWVRGGGSLLLIADHMPMAGAAESLAAEFGVQFYNGFALDAAAREGRMRFFRRDSSLADDVVTRGRNMAERVDSLTSFTGQAFRLTGPGRPLLTLPRGTVVWLPLVAWEFSRLTPHVSGAGLLQGAVLPFGQGRVAVFGEAAMFSAQLAGPHRQPVGMNDPNAPRNPQFLLNVMRWLTGALPEW